MNSAEITGRRRSWKAANAGGSCQLLSNCTVVDSVRRECQAATEGSSSGSLSMIASPWGAFHAAGGTIRMLRLLRLFMRRPRIPSVSSHRSLRSDRRAFCYRETRNGIHVSDVRRSIDNNSLDEVSFDEHDSPREGYTPPFACPLPRNDLPLPCYASHENDVTCSPYAH